MNQRSRWKDHDHWSCLGHVPPISLPATAARCYMVGCSLRPSEEFRPEEQPEPEPVATTNAVAYIGLPGTERCATCHNPNATDINRRVAGSNCEVVTGTLDDQSIDLKYMVHAIHAAR